MEEVLVSFLNTMFLHCSIGKSNILAGQIEKYTSYTFHPVPIKQTDNEYVLNMGKLDEESGTHITGEYNFIFDLTPSKCVKKISVKKNKI